MTKRLLATAFCGVLIATSLAAAPAADAAAAPHGTPCNAHGFESKARDVQGKTFVKLTRSRTISYSGPQTIRKGKRIQSDHAWSIDANASAKGGLEIGASGVLKKVVKIFSNIHTEATWFAHVTDNSSESKTIVLNHRMRVRHATSVVFFAGWFGAKGTAMYSYCDAIEGSGEGYVKWQKASWHTFGGRGSGAQDCRVTAYDRIAQAAKDRFCIHTG